MGVRRTARTKASAGWGSVKARRFPARPRHGRDIEIGLVDVDPALVDGPDRVGVRVDAEHLHPVGGQDARRRQTDIAQTYHAHALDGHVWMRSSTVPLDSSRPGSIPRTGRRPPMDHSVGGGAVRRGEEANRHRVVLRGMGLCGIRPLPTLGEDVRGALLDSDTIEEFEPDQASMGADGPRDPLADVRLLPASPRNSSSSPGTTRNTRRRRGPSHPQNPICTRVPLRPSSATARPSRCHRASVERITRPNWSWSSVDDAGA